MLKSVFFGRKKKGWEGRKEEGRKEKMRAIRVLQLHPLTKVHFQRGNLSPPTLTSKKHSLGQYLAKWMKARNEKYSMHKLKIIYQ